MYTADFLIQRRKDKWNELKSIEHDKKLRTAIANELLNNKALLNEVKQYPEKLIELVVEACAAILKLLLDSAAQISGAVGHGICLRDQKIHQFLVPFQGQV